MLDAKEKLGPLYYNSRLVECPQNAIEISKLLQTYSEIDKKSFQVREENRRQQRQLIHNLESRYSFTRRFSLQDQKVSDIRLPPSGFRYHADGTPKLVRVPMATDFRDTEDRQYFNDSDSECEGTDNIYTNYTQSGSNQIESSPGEKTTDGKNLVKISEKLIKQIKQELELNEADIERQKKFFSSKDGTKPRVSFQLSGKAASHGSVRRKPSIDIDKSSVDDRRHSFSQFDRKNDSNDILNRVSSGGYGGMKADILRGNISNEASGQPKSLTRKTSVPLTAWKYSTNANSLENKHYSYVTLKTNRKPSAHSSPLLFLKDKKSSKTIKSEPETSNSKNTVKQTSTSDIKLRRLSSAIPIRTTEGVKLLGRCSSANILKQFQVWLN